MKARNIIILCALFSTIIAAVAIFLPANESTNAGEYLKKASDYDATGDNLKQRTYTIENEVKNKQSLLNSKLQKLDESILILKKNQNKNNELIDAAKKVQEQLLDDYCKDMAELGQTNIEQCKRKQ